MELETNDTQPEPVVEPGKLEEYTYWQLADAADCGSPDGEDSPGANWLRLVYSAAQDIVDTLDPEDRFDDIEDQVHEAADNIVPIYTHEKWKVFVDLCAYQEDVEDFGPFDDFDKASGVAVYLIAERLIRHLLEEYFENLEEAEEDDDEFEEDDTEEDED